MLEEIHDAAFRLEFEPESTPEYVVYLNFLETFSTRVDEISDECIYVDKLYGLIKKYRVPIPDEEHAVYKVMKFIYTVMLS